MLYVQQASAGSGKTFFITWFFIQLALKSPHRWRHILAVTFTNDAASEMKVRIVEGLVELSKDPVSSKYLSFIQQNTGYATEEIQEKSQEILQQVLQHLDQLQVVTLDRFFQQMLRSFAREIGLNAGFELQLNTRMAMEEVVWGLMQSLKPGSSTTQWLTEFALGQIDQGKNWKIRSQIEDFGLQMFTEQFQSVQGTVAAFIREDTLKDFWPGVKQVRRELEEELSRKGRNLEQLARENGLSTEDFAYKATGGWSVVLNAIQVAKEGSAAWRIPVARVQQFRDDPEKWVSKTHPQRKSVLDVVHQMLHAEFVDLIHFIEDNRGVWLACVAIEKYQYQLGLMGVLMEEMARYRQEKDVLLLADAAPILKQVGQDSPTSFIYEKLGNYYKHFIIDEFQDTSRLQWENFKPLIENSLAQGDASAIVGDVKQAIYRFRNGDWRLLSYEIAAELPIQAGVLKENFRSLPNIIAFNNRIFDVLPNLAVQTIQANIQERKEVLPHAWEQTYFDPVVQAYDGHSQEVGRKDRTGGYVTVESFYGDTAPERNQAALLLLENKLKDVLDRGYAQRDICILVEKNAQSGMIASHFAQSEVQARMGSAQIHFLTQEGLALQSHPALVILTGFLASFLPSPDPIALFTSAYLWNQHFYPDRIITPEKNLWEVGPLGEKVNALKKLSVGTLYALSHELVRILELESWPGAVTFLHHFFAIVSERQQQGDGDISGFLTWWNDPENTQYLASPEEEDAVKTMTIHKSKGLQFPVVILFMVNQNIWESRFPPILWIPLETRLLPKAPLVPIKGNFEVLGTDFNTRILHETADQVLDGLNRFYVACTRAARELHIHLNGQAENNSLAKLLLAKIGQLPDAEIRENGWCFGSPTQPLKDAEQREKEEGWKPGFAPDEPLIDALSIGGEDGWLVSSDAKDYGIWLHHLLSALDAKAGNLTKLVEGAHLKGWFTLEDRPEWEEKLRQIIDLPTLAWSFHEDAEVLAERTLLHPSWGAKRPDRVAIRDGVARVYDFKTGQPLPAHERQIRHYMESLQHMGFIVEGGYLIYTATLTEQIIHP